jgi:hypothetical protein
MSDARSRTWAMDFPQPEEVGLSSESLERA